MTSVHRPLQTQAVTSSSLALREEHRVLRPWHSLGWGNEVLSQFRSPSGITFSPNGDLCVADTNNHRLQILTQTGEVRHILGHGPGSGSSEFQQPTGLACDATCLYVADSGNCRLQKLALPSGQVLATVGAFGDQPGQLHAPVGLTFHDGQLYCADSRNHRISVFMTSPGLRYVTSFGSHGHGPGEFGSTSSGIYLAAYQGELFVAERSNHRLEVLGLDGRFLRSIGSRGTAPRSLPEYALPPLGSLDLGLSPRLVHSTRAHGGRDLTTRIYVKGGCLGMWGPILYSQE
jgi:sugar lactone lactonase YvrE